MKPSPLAYILGLNRTIMIMTYSVLPAAEALTFTFVMLMKFSVMNQAFEVCSSLHDYVRKTWE